MSSHEHPRCETPASDKSPGLIIRGGIALTMADNREIIQDPEVLIADGRIVGIGQAGECVTHGDCQAEIIDARGAIVMPG